MVNTVVEVYLGVLKGPQLAWELVIQTAWAISFVLICHWVLKIGIRRLVIQGG